MTFMAAVSMPSFAQDRSALIRALEKGRDFRVRVQAAFALGSSGDPSVRIPLERALLEDSNPAVRSASATALGRLGSRLSVPALRRAARDSSASVRLQASSAMRGLTDARKGDAPGRASRTEPSAFSPRFNVAPREGTISWPQVRYVVWVGDMVNKSGFAGEVLASKLKDEVRSRLRLLHGVAVFDGQHELAGQAKKQVQRRRIPKLRLEGNVVEVKRQRFRADLSIRCEVSIVLLEEPDRNMRGMLSGAATGTEPRHRKNGREQERRLAEQALEGAVRSAMSNAPQALARASRR